MAPISRRKLLVCFYCNKKSGIKYDGLITSWECARCTSTNFLDDNGEITDPPVATNDIPPSNAKHSYSRAHSPSSDTFSQVPSPSPFCATCLKNQHLLISSLQQFHVELDPSHPEYKESERKYYRYRQTLEKTYPQVCEACLPNMTRGLEAAHKTSKSDIMRRSLAKSRRRVRQAARGITFASVRDFIGKSLWYMGLIAQLLWHIIMLSAIADEHLKTTPDPSLPAFISDWICALSEASYILPKGRTLGFLGLICSVASLWWSPHFNNLNVGFHGHITGYRYWYKNQLVLLLVRGLFYSVMANEDVTGSLSSAIGAAHLFIFVFVTFLAIRAYSSIKVDMTRLWSTIPPNLPHIGPSSSPKQTGDTMLDILNDLRSEPPGLNRPANTPSPPLYGRFKPEPYQPGSTRINEPRTGPLQPLRELHVQPNRRPPSPPMFASENNPTPQSQPALDEQCANMNLDSTMDWSPVTAQPKSQHRAFTENLPVDKDAIFHGRSLPQEKTKLFGQSPVVPRNTFWFHVPPAPTTPAQQLRNPPNQPRMRTVSQEQKQNFFNNSRNSPPKQDMEKPGSQRVEMEFSQQKFFAPEVRSEGHDDLVTALGGWTIGESNIRKEIVQKGKSRFRHVGQGLALIIALVFWNQTLISPSEYNTYAFVSILFGCLCIGARTILDNTIWTEEYEQGVDHAAAFVFGILLGGLECAVALYGLGKILMGAECQACGPLGTVLTGGMLVCELWHLLF